MLARRVLLVRRWQLLVSSLLLFFCIAIAGCEPATDTGERPTESSLSDQLGGEEVTGFARALEPRELVFPADHGPHPEYRNEWWYLTGNLETPAGRRFGYQVTFFRIALAPPDRHAESRRSGWATRQVWMTHVALSDAANQSHEEYERFARGAAGLAGARVEPFRVWLDDWQLKGGGDVTDRSWQLSIETDGFTFDFALESLKPIVLQGHAGLSQKGAESGNASFYYSIPRLKTEGTIRVGDEELAVTGLSWLDREWSTSALGGDQVGWDWFALQLDDGRDLMYYSLRRKDGQPDPHSAGILVEAGGAAVRLRSGDVALEPKRWWRSVNGVRYPVAWLLRLADGSGYRVEAVFDEQLMDTTVTYWEGMVDVFDADTSEERGRGYLELVGYE